MQHRAPEEVLYVCGPTAAGKSALALELAERADGEIVNADAFQLYRGLEILSAAPSAADRARVPHHLYGVLDPAETSDARRFTDLALPLIRDILERGKLPIVTGGSGLYLKFLSHGATPLPPGDPVLRAEMDARPLEELAAELAATDPVEAARTNLRNRRYVSRALEIHRLSGRLPSELRDQWEGAARERESRLRGWLLRSARPWLHQRIARRTRVMLESGALDEVARLEQASATCGKAIGFAEIRDLLAGNIDLATCEERINAATRQYAKRQETWFRRERWLREWPADGAPASPFPGD